MVKQLWLFSKAQQNICFMHTSILSYVYLFQLQHMDLLQLQHMDLLQLQHMDLLQLQHTGWCTCIPPDPSVSWLYPFVCGSMAGGADNCIAQHMSAWETKQEPQEKINFCFGRKRPASSHNHTDNTQTSAGSDKTRQLDCVQDI